MRTINISQSAKRDFLEIKSYVVRKFGAGHWNTIAGEWKTHLKNIADNPGIGSHIDELDGTGYVNVKKYHYKNVIAVYSFSDTELEVHLFMPAMRDFRTHLMNRMLQGL
ncbi:MAG: type II toxin-antitoxin system RelE/ParE family toxin [Acidobacteriaceae bacterium]|jgi:plasmid stabilization system protein ParE|nr:type II toxin-antitoxin system RelE/ParE family toxin [Acidobacteriaceae bacterium]